MFIATVSYGLAVSVPCGEDAERAVNSTPPGTKAPSPCQARRRGPDVEMAAEMRCRDAPGAPALGVPDTDVLPILVRDILEAALVHPCFHSCPASQGTLIYSHKRARELPLQSLRCIIPGKSPSLPQGVSSSPLDDGDEPCSSQHCSTRHTSHQPKGEAGGTADGFPLLCW